MIYLIGGAPRCGKTILAKLLSKKLNIPWIATDTLESVAMVYTSKKDFNKCFPKSVIRRKTQYSNDIMYAQYSTKHIAGAYIKQSRTVWKAIGQLAEYELKQGRSYIIEGYHIHPLLVVKLKKKFSARKIKGVFLAKFNIDGIVRHSKQFTSKTDWFVKKTNNKDTYPKIASMIGELSKYFEKEARKYNQKIYVMDTHFKTKHSEALRYLK